MMENIVQKICAALIAALYGLSEWFLAKREESKAQKEKRKIELENAKQKEQKRQHQEWLEMIERENGSEIRRVFADALNVSAIHTDMKSLKAATIKSKISHIDNAEQYWICELPVTAGAAYALKKDTDNTIDIMNQVFKNTQADAVKKFQQKLDVLINSESSHYDKNLHWRQFYANHYYDLHLWKLTDASVIDGRFHANLVIAETPAVQQFSPQQVYW